MDWVGDLVPAFAFGKIERGARLAVRGPRIGNEDKEQANRLDIAAGRRNEPRIALFLPSCRMEDRASSIRERIAGPWDRAWRA